MGETLSEDDISTIEDRCNKATPAPWLIDSDMRTRVYHDDFQPGRFMTCVQRQHIAQPTDWRIEGETTSGWWHTYAGADAEFIANAREDIPRLVAEIRRLRKQLEGKEEIA